MLVQSKFFPYLSCSTGCCSMLCFNLISQLQCGTLHATLLTPSMLCASHHYTLSFPVVSHHLTLSHSSLFFSHIFLAFSSIQKDHPILGDPMQCYSLFIMIKLLISTTGSVCVISSFASICFISQL